MTIWSSMFGTHIIGFRPTRKEAFDYAFSKAFARSKGKYGKEHYTQWLKLHDLADGSSAQMTYMQRMGFPLPNAKRCRIRFKDVKQLVCMGLEFAQTEEAAMLSWGEKRK